ncbi:hypothetical protein K4K61_007755 [Colletotrichum sp. SAR11_59]|nr:hypothetical protein K4K61_007755 [Colletotrichum sp. SAR11_59]
MAGKTNHSSDGRKSSKKTSSHHGNQHSYSASSSTHAEHGSAGVTPRRAAEQTQYRDDRAGYARDYPQVQFKDDRQENRAKVMRNVNDLGDPRYARTYDPNLDI